MGLCETMAGKPTIFLSKWKKFFFSTIVLVGFFLATETLLALVGFENAYARRDPFAGFSKTSRLFVPDVVNDVPVLRTSAAKLSFFNPQSFPQEKSTATKRVFCLGGSTTFGRPFDDRTSYVNWLRQSLVRLDQSWSWEVINAGGISYASYRLLNLMEELIRYQPDLFIIYTGHNEFLEKRTYDPDIYDVDAAVHFLDPLFQTRLVGLCDLVLRSLSNRQPLRPQGANHLTSQSGLGLEVDAILDHSVGPAAYTRDAFHERMVIEHFESNLQKMVELAERVGAKIVFITPASNLKDFSPFKSEALSGLGPKEEDRWMQSYVAAKNFYNDGELVRAGEALATAEQIDASRADLQYLKGRLCFDRGETGQAYQWFEQAIDNDICPLRAKRLIAEAVSRVAMSSAVPLVDFVAILKEDCRDSFGHECCGDEYFLDHVHPNVSSHRILAGACLDAMKAIGWMSYQQSDKKIAIDEVARTIDASVDLALQANALTNLAQVLSWAGKQKEAGPLAAKALEIQNSIGDSDSESMFYAAVQYAMNGQDGTAIKMLQDLLREEPDHVEARWRLASLLYDRGSFHESVSHYRTAHRADKSNLNVYRMLGFALLRSGERIEAASLFRDYLKLVPDDEGVLFELDQLSEINN